MTPLPFNKIFSLLIFLLPFATAPLSAALQEPAELTIFDVLQTEGVLEVSLETDIEQIFKNRKNNDYVTGTLLFTDTEEQPQQWEVEVRPRGKFRRRICDFPPLKVKFSKEQLKAKGLKNHNELKLVTHCLDNKESKEYIIREYLAYKMYNLLSKKSFRTQLIEITYIDQLSGNKNRKYGILIEDEQTLEERYEAKVCDDCFNLPKDSFHTDNINTNDLFQYMIGNVDYSVPFLRNNKIFQPKDSSGFFVVPYDFDFSGFVNTPYARPKSNYGLKHIRQRFFIGNASSEEELQKTKVYFKSKQAELLALIDGFEELSKSSRKDAIEFLDTFFEYLDEGEIIGKIYDPFAPK